MDRRPALTTAAARSRALPPLPAAADEAWDDEDWDEDWSDDDGWNDEDDEDDEDWDLPF